MIINRDIIFGNETEAEAFAAANEWGTTDLKEIALRMAALPKVCRSLLFFSLSPFL